MRDLSERPRLDGVRVNVKPILSGRVGFGLPVEDSNARVAQADGDVSSDAGGCNGLCDTESSVAAMSLSGATIGTRADAE